MILTTSDDVYILEPLPEETDLERRRKGKAPMVLPVSTREPPHEPVPFTIFREEWEPIAQPPIIEDEHELVIPTQVIESLYTEDNSGEKRKLLKLVCVMNPWTLCFTWTRTQALVIYIPNFNHHDKLSSHEIMKAIFYKHIDYCIKGNSIE